MDDVFQYANEPGPLKLFQVHTPRTEARAMFFVNDSHKDPTVGNTLLSCPSSDSL